MSKNFTKTVENFTCAHCGAPVQGNGYTNHCPHCLTSLHVDIFPGDRAATCRGIMTARSLEIDNGKQYIVHVCNKCGHRRRNQVAPNDNIDALIAISHPRP
jgi:rubrerythrin